MACSVGVVGAGGYAGIELVRRLLVHPFFTLKTITDNQYAGSRLDAAYPSFLGSSDLVFSKRDDPSLMSLDAVFLAVPHTAAMGIAPDLLKHGVTVIDLSADYRLKDASVYEQWYGVAHTSPDLLSEAAFGLPEITSDELHHAADTVKSGRPALVACAGCYPTATSLAAYPAVHAGIVQGTVLAQAISGVTGAGKKPTARTHFCSADENVEAYKAGTHRHTPEIEQILGMPGNIVFIPHLAPLKRGLLSTVTMQIADDAAQGFDVDALRDEYVEFYSASPFVSVLPKGSLPRTDSVVGTNNAQVGISYDGRTHTLIAVGAIDNLEKGSAGQAVQCANIVFGRPQDEGFTDIAMPV